MVQLKPAHRLIIGSMIALACVAPAIVTISVQGHGKAARSTAESIRDDRLTVVSQNDLNRACYIAQTLSKGQEVNLPDGVPASSCAKSSDRFGYLEIAAGKVRVTEIFTPIEVQNKKSQLLKRN